MLQPKGTSLYRGAKFLRAEESRTTESAYLSRFYDTPIRIKVLEPRHGDMQDAARDRETKNLGKCRNSTFLSIAQSLTGIQRE